MREMEPLAIRMIRGGKKGKKRQVNGVEKKKEQ